MGFVKVRKISQDFSSGYAFLSLEAAIEEYEELNWKSYWVYRFLLFRFTRLSCDVMHI